MRKKYLSLLLISAVLAASLTGCGQKAAESDPGAEEATVDESEAQAAEIEQEFEFYSDKEDEMYYNLPDVVEQDGKSYELTTDISLETLGTRKVVQKVVESDVEDLAELPERMEYETDIGNTYTLTNEQVYVKEKDATISIPVTDTVVYEDQYGRPSIPGTKTITYFNKVTGQDEEIQGTLQEFYESTPGHWENSLHVDGVFQAPSTNVSEFTLAGTDNVTVPQSAATPEWATYQTDVLKSLGLSSKYFRINAAAWNGDAYTQDGYIMRNAVFEGDAYVSAYTAVYQGNGASIGYKTKVFYRADAEAVDAPDEDTTTVFKIKAVVRYKLMES